MRRLLIYLFLALIPAFLNAQFDIDMPDMYDSIPADTLKVKRHLQKIENFYDSIQAKAEKKSWSRRLFNAIVLPESTKDSTSDGSRSEEQFSTFEGKTIRSIVFIRLNPFGTSLSDTGYYNRTWVNKSINAIHVKTNRSVLERQLLIDKGDKVDPFVLADNERLIRELPFIDDVRFIVSEVELDDNLVDVTIITKDVWSTAFYLELKDLDAGKLELWNSNILGSGNELQDNIHWNGDKTGTWGNEVFFKNRNIFGSFIDGRIYHQNVFNKRSLGIEFERKFFTPNTKYAGGLNVYKRSRPTDIWYYDTASVKETVGYSNLDFWIGRAFRLDKIDNEEIGRKNFILASRTIWKTFNERPYFEEQNLPEFSSSFTLLNYIAFSSQNFYKANLIFNFGRTEDIPAGYLAKWTFGPQFGEFDIRFYNSVELSRGRHFSNLGYIYLSAAMGGYVTREKEFQQGVFRTELNYFTNLHNAGRFKLRHFVNLYFIRGINRFTTERININDQIGLTGLSKNQINGKQKIVLNLQSVSFAPYYLYGWRFAFFGFADFALLGKQKMALKQFNTYTSFGAGIRFRNERLIFPTFQLRFSFYPNLSGMKFGDYITFLGEEKLNPRNFYTNAPAEIEYK